MTIGQTHGAVDSGSSLESWFTGVLGATLLERESAVLYQSVRRFHGDTLLWLGPVVMPRLPLERCMVRHRLYGALSRSAVAPHTLGAGASVFQGRIEELPFAPGSLDAVVVHHGFECTRDPRSAIREIARALRPGGRVLVCGFNPWSFWGLRRLFGSASNAQLASTRFVSPGRLLDWLAVLGFEVDEGMRYLMYRPPVTGIDFDRSWWRRFRKLLERWRVPIGGVYFVLARKTAVGLLPLAELRGARAPRLVVAALPGSSARTT